MWWYLFSDCGHRWFSCHTNHCSLRLQKRYLLKNSTTVLTMNKLSYFNSRIYFTSCSYIHKETAAAPGPALPNTTALLAWSKAVWLFLSLDRQLFYELTGCSVNVTSRICVLFLDRSESLILVVVTNSWHLYKKHMAISTCMEFREKMTHPKSMCLCMPEMPEVIIMPLYVHSRHQNDM